MTLLTGESESDDTDLENVSENNGPPSSSFTAFALQLQQDAEDDDNEEYTTGLVVEVEDDISGISESNRQRGI
jgi:hypothetical protein